MSAHVIPRPAVEAAVLNVRGVIGRQVVAEPVAFIGCSPKLASFGLNRETDWITNPRREYTQPRTVGVVLKNVRAVEFSFLFIRIINIRKRTHRNEHFLRVGENTTLRVQCPRAWLAPGKSSGTI